MTAPGQLAKQHDAVFSILNADGTQRPIQAPKTSGQRHAERVTSSANRKP